MSTATLAFSPSSISYSGLFTRPTPAHSFGAAPAAPAPAPAAPAAPAPAAPAPAAPAPAAQAPDPSDSKKPYRFWVEFKDLASATGDFLAEIFNLIKRIIAAISRMLGLNSKVTVDGPRVNVDVDASQKDALELEKLSKEEIDSQFSQYKAKDKNLSETEFHAKKLHEFDKKYQEIAGQLKLDKILALYPNSNIAPLITHSIAMDAGSPKAKLMEQVRTTLIYGQRLLDASPELESSLSSEYLAAIRSYRLNSDSQTDAHGNVNNLQDGDKKAPINDSAVAQSTNRNPMEAAAEPQDLEVVGAKGTVVKAAEPGHSPVEGAAISPSKLSRFDQFASKDKTPIEVGPEDYEDEFVSSPSPAPRG